MYYPSTATSTSADFLTFVVTILKRLSRPHGINHTSFIVYLPNLRIKVTVAFGNFTVLCQLVRLIRLHIRFLFVRPRVRYCFFSPKRHRLKLASRYRVRRQLRPEWTFTTDVWHARHTKQTAGSTIELPAVCFYSSIWKLLSILSTVLPSTPL
jgi:hypothetical protein